MQTPTGKSDRLDAAVAEYLQRIERGEAVDWAEFVSRHPDLADELTAFLNADASLAKAVESGKTVDFADVRTPSRSRGLQIRCPHCSNHVELLIDTPFQDINCSSCGSVFSLVDRDEQTRLATPLKTIGRFELVSRLGVGGFGSVWKARDKELDRIVAIKIPRKGQLSAGETDQFFREARAAAQLRHPNIVPVHEVGRDGDTIFIVCDLVRGADLSDWLTANRPSPRESAELCGKIARALHHAHTEKVIHRDLKPSNVMIDVEGEPHLMDFGLAKREVGEITMTVDGQLLGTPAYMSPEQAAGRSHWTDRRTDIYSLGVIMYRLLTGELPFRGNAQMQVLQRLSEDPPDPRTLSRHIPRDLSTICLKCLERDPNRRYGSAAEVADELERYGQGLPILARPLSPAGRAVRWAKRKPWLAATLGLGVILAVGGPAAAVKINADRLRVAEDAIKYHRLVDQYGAEKQQLTAENGDLQRDNQLLTSTADPWKTWRPTAELGPRRQFLDEIYSRRFVEAAARLDTATLPPWDEAVGRMALGTLAYATEHVREADEQFVAAERLLRPLVHAHPDDASYSAALAACCESRALLTFEQDPKVASELLNEASAIYERLATLGGHDKLRHLIDRAEAEMRGAVSDRANAVVHSRKAADELRRVVDEWPENPLTLYGLVMHMVEDEAVGPPIRLPAESRDEPAQR